MKRAGVAIAVLATARAVYLIWLSPHELVADEAQYWDWSRRLALSYYSKGPGVAWAIVASTSAIIMTTGAPFIACWALRSGRPRARSGRRHRFVGLVRDATIAHPADLGCIAGGRDGDRSSTREVRG